MNQTFLFLALLTFFGAPSASAQRGQLPFSAEENADGARFVWFVMGRSGFTYRYIPADSFPKSDTFREVGPDSARAGDVAWWAGLVAIYAGPPDHTLVMVGEQVSLAQMSKRRGKPRFFRKLVLITE